MDRISGIVKPTDSDVGIEFINNRPPSYVRFISEAILYINTDYDSTILHRIIKPYVKLTYANRKVGDTNTVGCRMEVSYSSRIDKFLQTAYWTFWVATSLSVVIVFFKMLVWYQYHPSTFQPENFEIHFISRLIINLFTVWSFTIFWYMFIISAYWFIFFKWERYNFSFFPQASEQLDAYMNWRVIFWVMFSGLMFQAAVDRFLMQGLDL